MHSGRPTWLEIDLDALAYNVQAFKRWIGPRCELMAVVKADAYGHGVVPVARTALANGASRLGVALVEEAIELREAGIAAPILVLGWTPPECSAQVVQYGLAQAIFDEESARLLSQEALRRERKARLHIKIDTGMGRIGLRAEDPATEATIRRIAALPATEIEGIYTHFASAGEDDAYTLEQLRSFLALLDRLRDLRRRIPLRHAANTGAILTLSETHLDCVRAGIGLYGYLPNPSRRPPFPLRPVMSWKTRIASVRTLPAGASISYGRTYVAKRPERVATLPVGYADGLSRALSNRGAVLIAGQMAPVLGRVCMDQVVVSLEGIEEAAVGDEVVLLGRQGDRVVDADAMAAWCGTISYEVLCGVSRRVPRQYFHGKQPVSP